MTADSLDPVIHAPARLRIVATLAALPEGASLSFTRLQDVLELTPGNLITHLRKLEDAGYLQSETTGNGRASRTSIALTRHGRAALDTYTDALDPRSRESPSGSRSYGQRLPTPSDSGSPPRQAATWLTSLHG
jgi:DNA-binding MarR family transcriptional regulator